MLRVFQTTINICRLGFVLARLRFSKKVTVKLSQDIVHSIMRCGSVTIKFGQWFATKYDISSIEPQPLYAELQKTLENCPEHDIRYTRSVFKKSFGVNLEDTIKLHDDKPFASGSVGQVYKGTMDGEEIVMKVMHPNIKIDYRVTAFFLKAIGSFFGGIDINEFLRNVRSQYDYENEANNLKRMYDFYADDDMIIIPRLLMHSKNVIVMSCEDGVDFDQIEQEVMKQKIALSILSFQRQNATIFGCIHGDLHCGNWKVRKEGNSFKLVIYDFGLVNEVDPVLMEKWVKAYQYQDYETLIDIALEHSSGTFDPDVKDIIHENCKVLIHPKATMMKTLKVIVPIMARYNIRMLDNFLSIIVSFALTENILNNLDRGTMLIDTQNGYISNCLDIIAFCESKNTCRHLQKQLEEDISDTKLTKMFSRSDTIIESCSLDDFYKDSMSAELS